MDRNIDLFLNKRSDSYDRVITDFGYIKLAKAEQIESIHAALSMIHIQLERQIDQLEIVDSTLIRAVKVFFYECEKHIMKTMPSEGQHKLISELI